MVALWLVSLVLRDASVADPFWGLGFALVAVVGLFLSEPSPRAVLAAGLTAAWGLRLTVHLSNRWARSGEEDRRYRAMRAGWGDRFPAVSLFTVFLLQGALLWTVSLPLQAAVAGGAGRPLGLLDLLGAGLVIAGIAFEAVADAQLARFLRDRKARGEVLQTGLWRYTRHPNYFGDALVWWGVGLLAAAAGAPWALVGSALMTFLLVRVSGVALLEKDIAARRPGYAAYAARTSAFVPWPPRRVRG
ncbi:MAG: DUF1295 domain-containing protein [Deltaproteobacteria bacterium]|nr:DUF1295 domain-containing protein [Deltaproteobacteria bacterium]